MKTKVTMTLLVISLFLMGICIISFVSMDTTAPVITLPDADITYSAGTDQNILLQGVTAYDEEDGDLSDKVRIYDIAVLEDGARAQVIYAVYDESYNLGKASCVVNYVPPVKENVTEAETDIENTEDTTEEKTEEKKDTEEEPVNDSEEEDTEEEDTEEEDTEDEVSETPVIRLTNSKVNVAKGGSFNSLSYVASVTDDEDSREYLYRNIHIDGDYNLNQDGEYVLTYYCMDSDGNTSNKAKLTLVVGEKQQERSEEETAESR